MSTEMKNDKSNLVPEECRSEIDQWLAKYPPEHPRSAVMAGLRIVQEANGGFLTTDLMDAVADYLGIPHMMAYEVATFYSMYEHSPVGHHKICVCTNISCLLRGSDEIVNHLKSRLGIGFGETTADGRFSLKEVECLGACVGAPMFQIDRQYYENLTPEIIDQILEQLD